MGCNFFLFCVLIRTYRTSRYHKQNVTESVESAALVLFILVHYAGKMLKFVVSVVLVQFVVFIV